MNLSRIGVFRKGDLQSSTVSSDTNNQERIYTDLGIRAYDDT